MKKIMNMKTQKQKLSKMKTEKKLTEHSESMDKLKQPNHVPFESLKEVKEKGVTETF